jgi:L-amino acid N-acyltransferase YncA
MKPKTGMWTQIYEDNYRYYQDMTQEDLNEIIEIYEEMLKKQHLIRDIKEAMDRSEDEMNKFHYDGED